MPNVIILGKSVPKAHQLLESMNSFSQSKHHVTTATPLDSAAKLRVLLEKRQSFIKPTQLDFNKSSSEGDSQETLSMEDMATLLDDSYNLTKHLEEQVHFYQDTVNMLRQRSEEIVKENEALYEKLKENLVTDALEKEHLNMEQIKSESRVSFQHGKEELEREMVKPEPPSEHVEEMNINDKTQVGLNFQDRRYFHQLGQEMDKVKKLNQEKSRRLEDILQSTRDDLQEYRDLASKLQSKLRKYETESGQYTHEDDMCVQCQKKDGVFTSQPSEAHMKTVAKLTRERDGLMETLVKQKSFLTQSQQREFEAYIEVKKSMETVEEAQLEKAQAMIKIQQLRFSLEEERRRQENALISIQGKTKQELSDMKEDYDKKYAELQAKLQDQIQKFDIVDNQLEKLSRDKVNLITELEKVKAGLVASRLDVTKVSDDTKEEIVKKTCEVVKAQQEIDKLHNIQDRQLREHEQEKASLVTENEELRRRLVEAQDGWVESREECIRTLEKFKKIENDLHLTTVSSANLEKARKESAEFFKKQQEEREKQFLETIQQKENEHVALRAELEEMLESQMKLSNTVQEESKKMAQKLEEKTRKYKSDKQEWQQQHSQLSIEHQTLVKQHENITKKNQEDCKMNKKLSNKVEFLKKENKKAMKTMYELLKRQSSLMKDRQYLSHELEQLKLNHGAPKTSRTNLPNQEVLGSGRVITHDNSDDNDDNTLSDGKLISEHSQHTNTDKGDESL